MRSEWGAAVLALLALAGCSTNLLHGLDERGANEAVAVLERAGVAADKVTDDTGAALGAAATFTVRVPRGEGARALDLLRAAGLPRDRRRGFAETYGQPSLIPTASEERARYLDALSGEIERTLEAADGVVGARVHLVPEEGDPGGLDDPGGRPHSAARAAVLLKVRAGRASLTEADVRRLVSGSVPGLEPTAVAVVTIAAAEPSESRPVLAAVGPLRVTPGTRPLLIAALAVGLFVLAGLAALLLVLARRLAALERAASVLQRKT